MDASSAREIKARLVKRTSCLEKCVASKLANVIGVRVS